MRLSEKQVDTIVRKIIETLKQKQLITFKEKELIVLKGMKEKFLENLRAEDKISKEASQLLEQTLKTSNASINASIDERRMLHMIKKELAKKYNVII